jgi:hypothetical protein
VGSAAAELHSAHTAIVARVHLTTMADAMGRPLPGFIFMMLS